MSRISIFEAVTSLFALLAVSAVHLAGQEGDGGSPVSHRNHPVPGDFDEDQFDEDEEEQVWAQ